jgi:hypothetical protein
MLLDYLLSLKISLKNNTGPPFGSKKNDNTNAKGYATITNPIFPNFFNAVHPPIFILYIKIYGKIRKRFHFFLKAKICVKRKREHPFKGVP